MPAQASAETPLHLEATNSCAGCDDSEPRCAVTVDVDGGTVAVAYTESHCTPTGCAGGCPAVCVNDVAACNVPALPAGHYDVQVNGTHQAMLVVAADGGVDSCSVADGQTP